MCKSASVGTLFTGGGYFTPSFLDTVLDLFLAERRAGAREMEVCFDVVIALDCSILYHVVQPMALLVRQSRVFSLLA